MVITDIENWVNGSLCMLIKCTGSQSSIVIFVYKSIYKYIAVTENIDFY
jgi:hypothetical protein